MRVSSLGRLDKRWIFLAVVVLFYLPHLLTPNRFFVGQDTLAVGFANKSLVARVMGEEHRLPLWNPRPYCGVPFLGSLSMGLLYPTGWLYAITPTPLAMTLGFFLHTLLAGTGAYVLSGKMVRRPEARLFAALVYAFSGDLITHVYAGHDGKIFVMSWAPWALSLLMDAMEGRKSGWLLLCCVFTLSLLSPHIQCTYYLGMACVLCVLYSRLVEERNPKNLFQTGTLLGLVSLLAALVSLPQLLPAWQLSRIASRGVLSYEHATFFSLPLEELFDLLIPSFTGEGPGYWGGRLFKHYTHYLGVLPLLLAGLGALQRRRWRGFWIALYVFGLVMALGGNTPLYKIAYLLLPLVKKMRSPETIHFLCTLSLTSLSAVGFETVLEKDLHRWRRPLLFFVLLLSIPGLVCLFPPLYEAACTSLFGQGMEDDGRALLQANAPLAAKAALGFFTLLGISWLLCRFKGSGRLSRSLWVVGSLLLATGDLWHLDLRYLTTTTPEEVFPEDPIVAKLKELPARQRVLQIDPSTFGSPYTYGHLGYHGIETVGGYQNLYLRWVDEIRSLLPKNPSRALDLMNCRYIVSSRQDLSRILDARKIMATEKASLFERPSSFPPYRLARKVLWCETEEDMMERIADPNLNVAEVAVALKRPDSPPNTSPLKLEPTSKVVTVEMDSNRRLFEINSVSPGFLIVSETYHPHWHAKIDGSSLPLYRTQVAFMGFEIPAGRHRVELQFSPPGLNVSLLFSVVSFALLGTLGLALRARENLKRQNVPGAK